MQWYQKRQSGNIQYHFKFQSLHTLQMSTVCTASSNFSTSRGMVFKAFMLIMQLHKSICICTCVHRPIIISHALQQKAVLRNVEFHLD